MSAEETQYVWNVRVNSSSYNVVANTAINALNKVLSFQETDMEKTNVEYKAPQVKDIHVTIICTLQIP